MNWTQPQSCKLFWEESQVVAQSSNAEANNIVVTQLKRVNMRE